MAERYAQPLQAGSAISFSSLIQNTAGGGGGSGTVTSVSAGTGMSFSTITTTGAVSLDTTKVPYLASGFSSGLLKWNGSAWVFDTSSYITGITSGMITTALGYTPVPDTRTLTINGTTFDLSANRSWTVGDLVSTTLYYDPTWLASLAWSKITGTPTTLAGYGITNAVPSTRTLTINGTAFDLSADRTWTIATGMTNPMTSVGDLIVGTTAGAPSRLAIGTNGQVLTSNGTTAVWQTLSALTNPMTTAGDIIYGGASGTPTRLGIGTSGWFLQAGASAPAWFNLFGTSNTWSLSQTIQLNGAVNRTLILQPMSGSSSLTAFAGTAGQAISFSSGAFGIIVTHNQSFNAPWIYPIFTLANRAIASYTATVPQLQLRISTLSGITERSVEWAMPTNQAFTTYDVAIRYDLFSTSSSYRFVQHYMRTSIDTAGALATASALLHIGAAATGYAQINLKTSAGTNPSAPADGDIWYDGTNLKMRVGATTKTFTLI